MVKGTEVEWGTCSHIVSLNRTPMGLRVGILVFLMLSLVARKLPSLDTQTMLDLWLSVTFRFRRNLDIAGNRRLGGQECIWLIAIDYHTVTGTASVECKGDQRSKRPRQLKSRTDSDGFTETQERGGLEVEQEGQMRAE